MEIIEMIKQFKNNDRSNFNKFYDLTHRQIYFSAYCILKDHQLAEDVMQETFINFLNHIDEFKLNQNVYCYLSIISRNIAINIYNKNKNIINNDEMIQNNLTYTSINNKDIDHILNLLDDEIEKEVVTYHVILEYKFKEISKILNKPLGTILWIYNKALKKLKERIDVLL